MEKEFNLEEILVDSSRIIADMAVELVGNDPEKFNAAFELTAAQKPKYSMRAGRVVDLVSRRYPELIKPYLCRIISELPRVTNESVKRCFLKIIVDNPYNKQDDNLAVLMNCCFDWLADGKQSIATRAYSMMILYNISSLEPEIKNELLMVIEAQMPTASTGLKSIGRRLMKNLRKEIP